MSNKEGDIKNSIIRLIFVTICLFAGNLDARNAWIWVWRKDAFADPQHDDLRTTFNNGADAVAMTDYNQATRAIIAVTQGVRQYVSEWAGDTHKGTFEPDDRYGYTANGCVAYSASNKHVLFYENPPHPYLQYVVYCRNQIDVYEDNWPVSLVLSVDAPAFQWSNDYHVAIATYLGENENPYVSVLFWDHGSNGDGAYMRISTDDGATWQQAGRFQRCDSTEFRFPSLHANWSSTNKIVIVYQLGSDVRWVCMRDDDDDGVMEFPDDPPQWRDREEPSLAGIGDNLFVCYVNPENEKVYYRTSTDHGSTWSDEDRVGSHRLSEDFSYYAPHATMFYDGDKYHIMVVCEADVEWSGDCYFVISVCYALWQPGNTPVWQRSDFWLNNWTEDDCDDESNPSISIFDPASSTPRARAVWTDNVDEFRHLYWNHAEWRPIEAALPPVVVDGAGRRLVPSNDGQLYYCGQNDGNIVAGPVLPSCFLTPGLVSGGSISATAVDPGDRQWVVFVHDDTLWCRMCKGNTNPIFAGSASAQPSQLSIAMYSDAGPNGYVAGVVFAVYDTVEETSMIMFAKVDTGTVILDTIDTRNDLADSFPCINIVNTDSVYVTYQQGTQVLSSVLYDYPAGSTERPPDWTALPIITADGFHPMSALEGGILHCVYARRIQPEEESDTLVICHSTLDVTDSPQFSSWQDGADPSSRTTLNKDNPVYAGVGVTVWQEMLNNKWAIRGCVRAETLTFVSKANHCRYPQAIAESSAVSPSIDQIRVKLLWTEEVCEDTAVLGFKVESLNVSKASANATRYNNGRKLERKQGSDSLFAVYVDLDGAVMFARSANGDSWKRSVITEDCENPAIAEDGTDRRWVVMNYTGNACTERIEARYLKANTAWSDAQVLYSASGQGSFGPVSVAGAPDEESSCCYAAFLYHNGSGNRFLIVAKFDGDSVRADTVATGDNLSDPAIAVEPSPQGDYLHLVWTDNGEVKYTMSESRISANNWDFGFPSDWKGAVNLSNSQTPSVHPVIAADQNRIVVSWAEGVIPEILARYRSTQDEYNIWFGPLNLSNTQDHISDYPTIALSDTCVITWQEQGQNEDYDIMASVEFTDAFNINDNQTPSTYPHILFQKKVSGDSTIPYLHCIYSEAPSQNYYEVGYHKLNLNQTGGGGQQGGKFAYLEPRLYQCAPNPFSRKTSIRFQIGQRGNVNLKVYDIQGRLVKTLMSGEQKPGIYTLVWEGKDCHNRQVANGVYFYRLDGPGITDTKKTVLMR